VNRLPKSFWYVLVLLGLFFDVLFWRQLPGVNFALYATLCTAGGLLLLRSMEVRPARGALWLLLPIAFFAVITFVRIEPMTDMAARLFTLGAMALLALTYAGGRWACYGLPDFLGKGLSLAGSMLGWPIIFPGVLQPGESDRARAGARTGLWPVLRGIAIALPILALLAALLSSADLVFASRLKVVLSWLNLERLPEYIFRGALIGAAAYALAGVILHAAARSRDEQLLADGKPALKPFLGSLEAIIVLGSVVLLFGAFVLIQFRYFFGGQANIHVEGFTYAEYARRGFGELVAVACISLALLLALSVVTRRERPHERRAFSWLGVSLVALVLVMLLSAYRRLVLYEAAYGFSRLRTYTHVFLIWVGLLLIAVIVLELMRKERAFALASLLAGAGFAASLALLNVDAFVARQNIRREIQRPQSDNSIELDAGYLLTLSDDALPALAEAFASPDTPPDVQATLGAVLVCRAHNRPVDADRASAGWPSFHVAIFRADAVLEQLDERLQGYEYDSNDGLGLVRSPSGAQLDCMPVFGD